MPKKLNIAETKVARINAILVDAMISGSSARLAELIPMFKIKLIPYTAMNLKNLCGPE